MSRSSDGKKMNPYGRTTCKGCIHYYVTWNPGHPHGCRYFGFRSRKVPCQVVRESSGKPCSLYQSRSLDANKPK